MTCDMSLNCVPNREKVLLNLKWFTNRVSKSFEAKFRSIINNNSRTGDNHSKLIPNLKQTPKIQPDVATDLPFLKRILQNDSKHHRLEENTKLPSTPKPNGIFRFSNTSLNRLKSMTNSPLRRRFNASRTTMDSTDSESSSILDSSQISLNQSLNSLESYKSNSSYKKVDCSRKFKIIKLNESTTEELRNRALTRFAESLSIIYEYQIGMLQGLKSIHIAADYTADVVLMAIKNGVIQSLSEYDLNATLLFDPNCRPQSHTKTVKSSPMTVTGERLSWKIGDMWQLPGLRHNEVGGENCNNLSIVTHFLSNQKSMNDPFTIGSKRPDIYGYRNIILKPSGGFPGSNETNCEKTCPYFDIFQHDTDIIKANDIRTGSKNDVIKTTSSSTNSRRQNGNSNGRKTMNNSSENSLSPINSASSLRQYLHRAYRPVFFVIFDRPTVLEHLTECDSFAAFCKRQSISPIMFINQETQTFINKHHESLFQNYSLFKITTNLSSSETNQIGSKKRDKVSNGAASLSDVNSSSNPNKISGDKNANGNCSHHKTTKKTSIAYENFGFDSVI